MTDNTTQSDSTLDLNQLKIKSSALRSSFPIIFSMLCLGGAGGGALLQLFSEKNTQSQITSSSEVNPLSRLKRKEKTSANFGNKPKPSTPVFDSPTIGGSEIVNFGNLKYPVTNQICNIKKSFCIYNLASLILEKKSKAYYRFAETNSKDGLTVINGYISVASIEQQGDNRLFTFQWEDDQSSTTNGYAAMGTFRLEQDPDQSKKGILTKFLTTKSFGSKTPVGLENTSYLFPQ